MIGVFVFPLCLLLPSVVRSEFPDFGDDHDEYERYVCEGDACARSVIFLWVDKTIQVPNKTVTFEDYAYFDVDTAGLLADCAPSLSVSDIAGMMKSCKEEDRRHQDACLYRKKGWLDQDGKTVNKSLGTDFKEIEGVSENIMKCLDWDGVDDYDYYDYGYYDYLYDYKENGLEESDDVQLRAKRDQKSNLSEFMIQKTRLKRSIDEKANIQKEENRLVKKRGTKKGKNNGNHGRNSRKKRNRQGKKQGHRRNKSDRKGKNRGQTRGKSGKKSGKGRRKSGNRKHKSAKKANKKKKKNQSRNKKGNNKKTKNQKKKEERKKKKKEKKLLKELGYDSMPSDEILNKLECVGRAIEYGLEKCGEKIFENMERP